MPKMKVRLVPNESKSFMEFMVETDKIGHAHLVLYKGIHYSYNTIVGSVGEPIAQFLEVVNSPVVELTDDELIK